MSHFSEHQVQQYRRLFDNFTSSNQQLGRLSLYELYNFLGQFGRERPLSEVKNLIYRYDSHCQGSLDFEDTLLLLEYLDVNRENEKEEAKRAFLHFQNKTGRGSLLREEFANILKFGKKSLTTDDIDLILDDFFPDRLGNYNPNRTNTKGMDSAQFLEHNAFTGLAWTPIKPPPAIASPFINNQIPIGVSSNISSVGGGIREILVTIASVKNLEPYARTRMRKGQKIDYFTLDPLVSVSCAGVTQETTVIIDCIKPEWDQTLTLPIQFPSHLLTTPPPNSNSSSPPNSPQATKGESNFEIFRWAEGQYITVSLFDYMVRGAQPHMEWIASGIIPLTVALMSDGAPAMVNLTLKSACIPPPNSLPIQAEIYIKMPKHSNLPTTNILPTSMNSNFYGELPEEIWHQKYGQKLKADLQNGGKIEDGNDGSTTNRSWGWEKGKSDSNFWDYYLNFYQNIKSKFRRRNFQLIGLTEYNQFAPLPTFVTPMYSTTSLATLEQIAQNVARITTYPSIPVNQPYPPIFPIQCSSPSLVLHRRIGSQMEHAILLAGLFLGRGVRAYVAIGSVKAERKVWVITFASTTENYNVKKKQAPEEPKNNKENGNGIIENTLNPSLAPLSISVSTPHNTTQITTELETKKTEKTEKPEMKSEKKDGLKKSYSNSSSVDGYDEDSGEDDSDDDERKSKGSKKLKNKIRSKKKRSKDGPDTISRTKSAEVAERIRQRRKSVFYSEKEEEEKPSLTISDANSLEILQFDKNKFWNFSSQLAEINLPTVTHWDPTTSMCYTSPTSKAFPFAQLGCLFDHRNVYINVQKHDAIPKINWDLSVIQDWTPFLPTPNSSVPTPRSQLPECWYSPPSLLNEGANEWNNQNLTRKLVHSLAPAIQLYRKMHLNINDTVWHREISLKLQEYMQSCEQYLTDKDNSFLDRLQGEVLKVLPNQCLFYFKAFHFSTVDTEEIIKQLSWTGILDSSVPNVIYTLSASVFSHPWSQISTWVIIGYIENLFYDSIKLLV